MVPTTRNLTAPPTPTNFHETLTTIILCSTNCEDKICDIKQFFWMTFAWYQFKIWEPGDFMHESHDMTYFPKSHHEIPWHSPLFRISLTIFQIPWLFPDLQKIKFYWLFPDVWQPWSEAKLSDFGISGNKHWFVRLGSTHEFSNFGMSKSQVEIKPPGDEAKIFWEHYINTMAPCITRAPFINIINWLLLYL